MGFFDSVARSFAKFLDWAGDSIRKLTAILFLVFTIGVAIGLHVAASGNPMNVQIALFAPLILAGISYISTGFAVIMFILIVLGLFFFI